MSRVTVVVVGVGAGICVLEVILVYISVLAVLVEIIVEGDGIKEKLDFKLFIIGFSFCDTNILGKNES